jgi:hypothetical protein
VVLVDALCGIEISTGKETKMDEVKELLAADAAIPAATVPSLLKELEKLQISMRTVDNHLLIIARSMVERSAMIARKRRAAKRAAAWRWTGGLAKSAAKALGQTAVAVVKAPVKLVRSFGPAKPAKAKSAKSAKSTKRKKPAKKLANPATT